MIDAIIIGVAIGLMVLVCNYIFFVKIFPNLTFLRKSMIITEIVLVTFLCLEFSIISKILQYVESFPGMQFGSTNHKIYLGLMTLFFFISVVAFVVVPAKKIERERNKVKKGSKKSSEEI